MDNNFEYASQLGAKMKELLLPDIIDKIDKLIVESGMRRFNKKLNRQQLIKDLAKDFTELTSEIDIGNGKTWDASFFLVDGDIYFIVGEYSCGIGFKYSMDEFDDNQFNNLMEYMLLVANKKLKE